MRKLSKVWLVVAGVIIIALAVYALSGSKKKEEISFETVAVAPANIMNSITATGTIEPVTSVTGGTQVSGIVSKLYVDYNSVVKKGQVIAELDKTVNSLNDNVSSLQTESSKKTETINAQDKQLNTAWYVVGTKKELKDQHIIDGSHVLESNFNKNYFTKIDIRIEKEVKLYSKSAKILTMHPSSSYTLQRDANKMYVLRINNPQLFWSTSKYLVIQVK